MKITTELVEVKGQMQLHTTVEVPGRKVRYLAVCVWPEQELDRRLYIREALRTIGQRIVDGTVPAE